MTASRRLPVALGTLLLVLSLAGCAAVKRLFTPPPPPVRAVPVPATPTPTPVRVTPPRETPPPVRAIPSPEVPPPPPRVLSPQISDVEADRLRREAQARIDGVEQRIRPIDPRTLDSDEQALLASIGSFVTKARAALDAEDPAQALNLAEKARILTDDLSSRRR